MTWTYSQNPATDTKDAIRFLVGDTVSTDQQASDEEILWAISAHSNLYQAAALVAESIAGRYARNATKKEVGDLKLWFDKRSGQYSSLAKSLRRRALLSADPSLPARTISSKDSAVADTDRTRPAFTRGQWDNPNAPDYNGAST